MKKLMFLLFVIVSVASQGQSVKAVVEKDFITYSQHIMNKEYDKGLEYLNEGFFEIMPRDQMKATLEQLFNNPELTIEMVNPTAGEFKEPVKIGDKFYVKFKSYTTIRMRFNNLIGPEKTAEENQNMITMLKENLGKQAGAENISYDEKTYFFTLKATKPVIASSVDKKSWKFITVDSEEQKPMLEKFIPKELLVD